MSGRPLATGAPLRSGYVLDGFRITAARSNGPPEPLFSRGLPCGGQRHAKFFARKCLWQASPDCPVPRSPPCSNMATEVAKRYVQAKSVVLRVPGQSRPAALDGG